MGATGMTLGDFSLSAIYFSSLALGVTAVKSTLLCIL